MKSLNSKAFLMLRSVIVLATFIMTMTAFAGSFSESFLEGKLDDSLLSPQCKSYLIDFYRRGLNLDLKAVRASLTEFDEWTEAHTQTDKKYMYHYTSHSQTIAYAKSGDINSVFQGLKLRSGALEVYGNSSGVLWTAGDPDSSKAFGNTLLKLEMDSRAMIFPYDLFHDEIFQQKLEEEIKKISVPISISCNWVNIAFFFLEDSGANIVLKNSGSSFEWFTVLNADFVHRVEVLAKN